ncbi:GNAT family N-acetyltransferase [Candidatus Methylospira mobilis]|uniref:GNAT family N-acetyltransferase n=1 Tax=Candidatus Methylospira mobilis TaxID=1808979 RepID=A0A5Q0BJ95_9GAMM|nr:GNAT family N-acetyltransferase [Candidatus Methylospira mobilis]QFY42281.1 GNAT family N-acetyltransferase [Candidatus Methylospira mobilis]WNV04004.1 GNAT family N-acetyltransferase [Candidatus Methylospira mobilis]
MTHIRIQSLAGTDLAPWIPDLARLRITVFRDFPYLYDGSFEYEENYLQTYLKSKDSIIILALDGQHVVGASTGLPLTDETGEFQQPFVEQGYEPGKVFYCAESVLLPSHRGKGIYKQFFSGREGHARALARFEYCSFCCVQRPEKHPLRPVDYVPLDAVWTRFGYRKQPSLVTHYSWKDVDEQQETEKPMVFWTKNIHAN